MLPVTLASAEAKDNSDPCDGCLPHSFSTMDCFSLEAIDITAALARCAMSRTDAPGVFAAVVNSAGLASAGFASAVRGGGTLSATRVDAAAGAISFGFGASANFGAAAGFGASASFGASIGLGASASAGASGGRAASATFEASPCGAEAANLSLNIIEGETVSGFDKSGAGA